LRREKFQANFAFLLIPLALVPLLLNFLCMVRQAMIFASVLSAVVVFGILGYTAYQQKNQFTKVKAKLADLQTAADENAARSAQLQQDLTNSHARIEALIREKEQATQNQKQMEQQMRSALESKEVTISELQGRLTVNILDRILFDSGEAELKPEGEKVLAQIASVLAQHTNRQVYVIGHTDNVPIRASAFNRYGSNWELSTARATSALRYLVEKAGADPKRMAAVGYGEFHPVADNSTAEGRAKNRRIAIVIIPEEFNPLEQLTNTNAPAQTISPPPAKTANDSEHSGE
jgi:chemotaxis protein MotB